MKNTTTIRGFLASSFLFGAIGVNAEQTLHRDQPIFTGSYQTVIDLNDEPFSNLNQLNTLTTEAITHTKIISLMRLNPTQEMIDRAENIAARIEVGALAEDDYSEGIKSFDKSESAHDLEMNGVPVLDQGQYGTCVTFASTAVLDALLSRGDFVDQQCSLALNLFLGNNYWDGAYYASEVIDPLKKHGVVEKNKCTAKYPAPSLKIKTEEYKNLVHGEVNVNDVKLAYHKRIELDDVRKAIDQGRRVAIGFQLKGNSDPISVRGFDAKIDGKKFKGGLWACKQPGSTKNYCGFATAGHEVIVTGYDDKQKLLRIRNSWTSSAGHIGDFYMTYEFFKAMAIDGTEVWL